MTTHDCGHSCCDERHDPMHDHFLAPDTCPSCVARDSHRAESEGGTRIVDHT